MSVGHEVAGDIGSGLLILLGVPRKTRKPTRITWPAKSSGLRVFEDESGKMNRSVSEAGGSLLVVSQFTLYGDVRHGKRPSFDAAAPPEKARALYEYFVGTHPHRGVGLRDRQVSGDDAGGTGQRRARDYPAGFIESFLESASPPAAGPPAGQNFEHVIPVVRP